MLLGAAGVIYAQRRGLPARAAAPILAAFLLQISFYLLPAFPEARARLEQRFAPARLALLTLAAALAPYLLYSLATGVFHWSSLLLLAGIVAIPAYVFVVAPTTSRGLAWQDLAAGGTVAAAILGKLFRTIYISPVEGLRLEVMGQIMITGVGAIAFLCLRRLDGSGYRLAMSWADWKTGLQQFALFLPVGAATAWVVGFAAFAPVKADPWTYPWLAAGTFLGMYAVVGLSEEFFFRGILQNLATASLGSAVAAQALSSVLFGLSHLPFRGFPNWRLALLAGIAGWFYGQAYRKRNSVVASSITHALVASTWRMLFA